MATFILTEEFKEILESQECNSLLKTKGFSNTSSFIKEIITRINKFDSSLKVKSISYHNLQDTDKYIGIILDENLNKIYNVCIIPPKLGTRSGFLTQQVFGFISNIILKSNLVSNNLLCDKPVLVINCMIADPLPNSAICNIISSKLIGFKYIDIFNRKEDFGKQIKTLEDYYTAIREYKDISKDFEIVNDTIIFKTERLKGLSESLTNEPYYFAINAYPALLLAHKEGYKIDITSFEAWYDNNPNNKNIIAFVRTAKILQKMPMNSDNTKYYLKYLVALRAKPFMLLAGISGTGKSRIVRKLAQASVTEDLQRRYDPKSVAKGFNRWELHKPANFELIQVKPNWHNSLEVVGYKSNIGGAHYEYTPFVEFVARAWKEPEVPFFLCLDEMNLAPVEQYFAEFLSAIENRSIENGFYETDPIIKPFESFDTKDDEGNVIDKLSDRMIAHLVGKLDTQRKSEIADRLRTKGLTLPQNLLVMGTVNMDETTFSFSRKVLDRAMSVVMNEVDYEGFFDGNTENDVAEMDEATRNLLIDRPIRGLETENNEADAVKEYLTKINEKLNDTPFKLGYRAANEALLYVSAAHKFNPDADIHVALDEFTMMKILSRIEGDKRSIGNLLNDLKEVITSDYPKSNEKLGKMAETLKNKQFVSYWT